MLNMLPEEMLIKIGQYLEPKDFVRFTLTSSRIHSVLAKSRLSWRKRLDVDEKMVGSAKTMTHCEATCPEKLLFFGKKPSYRLNLWIVKTLKSLAQLTEDPEWWENNKSLFITPIIY